MFGRRRRGGRGMGNVMRRSGRVLRWILRLALLFLIADLFYLAVIWPDWKKLATGPIPKSAFMQEYARQRAEHSQWPPLRWQPAPIATFPKTLLRAVILAEDSRFYEHSGFDLVAFQEAMEYNLREGRLVFGGSTISQQTAKNLFLSSSRNPLRKWHELILTWGMERNLSKRRILEIYLNVAQFGPGLYGVPAATQAYWGIRPEQLTPRQAAELAAALPSPMKNNPATRTRYFDRRARKLLALLERYPGDAAEAVRERPFDLFLPPEDNGADSAAAPPTEPTREPLFLGPETPETATTESASPEPSVRVEKLPPVDERSISPENP